MPYQNNTSIWEDLLFLHELTTPMLSKILNMIACQMQPLYFTEGEKYCQQFKLRFHKSCGSFGSLQPATFLRNTQTDKLIS